MLTLMLTLLLLLLLLSLTVCVVSGGGAVDVVDVVAAACVVSGGGVLLAWHVMALQFPLRCCGTCLCSSDFEWPFLMIKAAISSAAASPLNYCFFLILCNTAFCIR